MAKGGVEHLEQMTAATESLNENLGATARDKHQVVAGAEDSDNRRWYFGAGPTPETALCRLRRNMKLRNESGPQLSRVKEQGVLEVVRRVLGFLLTN